MGICTSMECVSVNCWGTGCLTADIPGKGQFLAKCTPIHKHKCVVEMFLKASSEGFGVGKTVTEAEGSVSATARYQVSSRCQVNGKRRAESWSALPSDTLECCLLRQAHCWNTCLHTWTASPCFPASCHPMGWLLMASGHFPGSWHSEKLGQVSAPNALQFMVRTLVSVQQIVSWTR